MSNGEWLVFISNTVISWVRSRSTQDPHSFGYYAQAIENIRNYARAMQPLHFIACGEGFKVYIKEEDIVLRCAYFIDQRQIHIMDIIQ